MTNAPHAWCTVYLIKITISKMREHFPRALQFLLPCLYPLQMMRPTPASFFSLIYGPVFHQQSATPWTFKHSRMNQLPKRVLISPVMYILSSAALPPSATRPPYAALPPSAALPLVCDTGTQRRSTERHSIIYGCSYCYFRDISRSIF